MNASAPAGLPHGHLASSSVLATARKNACWHLPGFLGVSPHWCSTVTPHASSRIFSIGTRQARPPKTLLAKDFAQHLALMLMRGPAATAAVVVTGREIGQRGLILLGARDLAHCILHMFIRLHDGIVWAVL